MYCMKRIAFVCAKRKGLVALNKKQSCRDVKHPVYKHILHPQTRQLQF